MKNTCSLALQCMHLLVYTQHNDLSICLLRTYVDLDECAQDSSLCDQICNNTFGSFMCACELGYVLVNDICEGESL